MEEKKKYIKRQNPRLVIEQNKNVAL